MNNRLWRFRPTFLSLHHTKKGRTNNTFMYGILAEFVKIFGEMFDMPIVLGYKFIADQKCSDKPNKEDVI